MPLFHKNLVVLGFTNVKKSKITTKLWALFFHPSFMVLSFRFHLSHPQNTSEPKPLQILYRENASSESEGCLRKGSKKS